ncbi:hypothetical protein ACL1FZ_12690, partial [Corynebacterium striatum]
MVVDYLSSQPNRAGYQVSTKQGSGPTPIMAAGPHHIDPTAYLEELLTQASPDLMRQMLGDFINQILS